MDPSCLYMDMHVDYFAEFMFLKNINNAIIELTLPEIENNKDMFFFLVDVICKGLVLLFGRDNKVELGDITLDNFRVVQQKMELAGIRVHLDVSPHDMDIPIAKLNLQEIEETKPDNLKLSEYVFTIINTNMIYNMSFELFHMSL